MNLFEIILVTVAGFLGWCVLSVILEPILDFLITIIVKPVFWVVALVVMIPVSLWCRLCLIAHEGWPWSKPK